MLKTNIPRVDAVLWWSGARAYLFSGDKYVRYCPIEGHAEPDYPRLISSAWKGMKFTRKVDAALNWGSGKTYFFCGDQYIRYDISDSKADAGYPRPISSAWAGMPFTDRVDAAIHWGDGKAYFFRDDRCVRYDIAKAHADSGYPRPISQVFPDLPFARKVDAAVNWGNGKAYFFCGAQYVRYDVAARRIDPGYPRTNNSAWTGVNFAELWHGGAASWKLRAKIEATLAQALKSGDPTAIAVMRRMRAEDNILEMTRHARGLVDFGKRANLTTDLVTGSIVLGPDTQWENDGVCPWDHAWKDLPDSNDGPLEDAGPSLKVTTEQGCEAVAAGIAGLAAFGMKKAPALERLFEAYAKGTTAQDACEWLIETFR